MFIELTSPDGIKCLYNTKNFDTVKCLEDGKCSVYFCSGYGELLTQEPYQVVKALLTQQPTKPWELAAMAKYLEASV